MKTGINLCLLLILVGCGSMNKKGEQEVLNMDCEWVMTKVQEQLFLSSPMIKGPQAVINHLEEHPAFIRNQKYDLGNGSVRFNAQNASFFDQPLVDDKSVFLLNYVEEGEGPETFTIFQAIYHFKSKADKDAALEVIRQSLDEELRIEKRVYSDLRFNPYDRYLFPCNGRMNLKHSPEDSETFFIDLLWAPE